MENRISYFKECFTYNDGNLIWGNRPLNHFSCIGSMKSFNTQFSGNIAGTPCNSKNSRTTYINVKIAGETYKAHRIIWEMLNGEIPKDKQIDHIDGNGTNNNIENLRLVDLSTQAKNKPLRITSTTGVDGVNWHNSAKKWQARATYKGKRIDLGRYDKFEDAVKAREAVSEKFGYHENNGRVSVD